ncbi:hypothetical protein TNIN_277061 [Trichonephila inaurata madagascariensis]|uniref:Uncharacterized protein n=1 Tax=Trichonephila inaurata madagascariensis TaxID=2747483 RepID=A0A8X6WTV0_9ARAC|nr:hypothetical protein TNIN_277061 [Trichonephila inaurata madagascariensis]
MARWDAKAKADVGSSFSLLVTRVRQGSIDYRRISQEQVVHFKKQKNRPLSDERDEKAVLQHGNERRGVGDGVPKKLLNWCGSRKEQDKEKFSDVRAI